MECAHHAGRQAVATCNRCGKGLCSECAERFDPPLCVACLLTHNRGVAIRLAAELAITAFIGVGITVFCGKSRGWNVGEWSFFRYYRYLRVLGVAVCRRPFFSPRLYFQ